MEKRWIIGVLCMVALIALLTTAIIFMFRPYDLTTPREIVFGQSAAFKRGGPAQMGRDLRHGVLAAFARANREGGIEGNTLRLVSMDDGYKPKRASANVKRMIEDLDVFAIVCPLGTPTTKAFLEQIIRNNSLMVGPYTGAEFLRHPFTRNIVNLRMSYEHEVSAIAFMLERTSRRRVAVFYQNDSYGQTILAALQEFHDSHVVEIVSRVYYERNTTDVGAAVDQLVAEAPDVDAVVMAGTSEACAKFIQKVNAQLQHAELAFFNVSFVGNEAFSRALKSTYKNIYVTQCVPDPTDTSLQVVQECADDADALDEFVRSTLRPSFAFLEGYLTGRLITHILGIIGRKNPELLLDYGGLREAFLDTLYTQGIVSLGGFRIGPYGDELCAPLSAGCPCNQGIRNIYMTQLQPDKTWRVLTQYTYNVSCNHTQVTLA